MLIKIHAYSGLCFLGMFDFLLTELVYFADQDVGILWPVPEMLASQFSSLGLEMGYHSNTRQHVAL